MAATTGDPFVVLELLGTVAFAVSGGACAVRAGMDWLGVVVLATVTAVGGGTLRDLLIDVPVRWVDNPWPLAVAAATAAVVIAVGHRVPHVALDSARSVLLADAAGLAAFTVSGTSVSLAAGVSGPIAAVLGVVTGAGGGVIRDVLARQRPLVLVSEIYALAALLGAAVVVLLTRADVAAPVVRWVGVVVVLAVRLTAVRRRWTLPGFAADREAGPFSDEG